jgi:anthranilate synthase/aminodeoxychorismate synthase-like glutamine amidotransferase
MINPLVVIDNYDSFTYNLVDQLCRLTIPTERSIIVIRNDEKSLVEIELINPSAIVVSPGPGNVKNGGITLDLLNSEKLLRIPFLGICLGHQLITHYYGGKIVKAKQPVHGERWEVKHTNLALFRGCRNPLYVARYHSLIAQKGSLPPWLICDAWTIDNEIMSIRHANLPRFGIQFHPESFLTDDGDIPIKNFLKLIC